MEKWRRAKGAVFYWQVAASKALKVIVGTEKESSCDLVASHAKMEVER